MALRMTFALVLPLLMFACSQEPSQQSFVPPTAPSAVSSFDAASSSTASSHATRVAGSALVNMMDACDPETFNAALGPGMCLRSGGIQFERFLELLRRHQSVGAWHFSPSNSNIMVGQHFSAINRGGEAHTFTEVEQFGGGIVPMLNDLSGTGAAAPECLELAPSDFVAPGATFETDAEDEGGVERYQCCIHPWMRLEARVREK